MHGKRSKWPLGADEYAMIIDIHTHIASHRILPTAFYDGWAENMLASQPGSMAKTGREHLSMLFARLNADLLCDELVAEMDAAGIKESVLLMIDFSFAYQDLEVTIDDLVDHHVAVMGRHPGRFISFYGCDPRRGASGVASFRQAVEKLGFKGAKLYPPCGYSPSAEALYPYFEVCNEYGLPVLTHTGPSSPNLSFSHTRPIDIDDAARIFPQVNFILAHSAVMNYRDSALLAEYRPNVFLDMAGFQNEIRRNEFTDVMAFHKKRGILHKILFGSDWPIFRMFGGQLTWVSQLQKLVEDKVITTEEYNLVMYQNAAKLLGKSQ